MRACGGDLHSALGERLTADVRQIGRVVAVSPPMPTIMDRGTYDRRILEDGDGLGQRLRPEDGGVRNDRGLGRIAPRQQDALQPRSARRHDGRQDAPRRLNGAVERQLAQNQHIVQDAPREPSGRGEHAHRDREIVGRPRLAQVGRGEVDGDAMRGIVEPRVANRGPDPIAAFAHAGVGQPDQRERGHAERDVDLDENDRGLDADQGRGAQLREHGDDRCKTRDHQPGARKPGTRAGESDPVAGSPARRLCGLAGTATRSASIVRPGRALRPWSGNGPRCSQPRGLSLGDRQEPARCPLLRRAAGVASVDRQSVTRRDAIRAQPVR